MSNVLNVASMGAIDSVRTIEALVASLTLIAASDGTPIPRRGSALDKAQAYRRAMDPEVQQPVASGPSKHRGVALARALGLLAAHEIMRPNIVAMRSTRGAADELSEVLARFCAANDELRRLGQRHTPLFEVQEGARQLLLTLTAARLRIPLSFSALSDGEQEEVLLMHVTLALSVAFKPAEIARLVDDRKGGDLDAMRARVRTRRRALKRWRDPYSEFWHIPPGGQQGE